MAGEFLSAEWLAELNEFLARADVPEGMAGISIAQVVTGRDSASYAIQLGGPGGLRAVVPAPADCDVVLTASRQTLAAIASGKLTVGQAMAAGAVSMRGDIAHLLRVADDLAAIAGLSRPSGVEPD